VNGKVVKIEGNPLSPVNQGKLCPKGHSAVLELYHPDRLRKPLKRAGKRGEGKWESISWDEAIQTFARKLQELHSQKKPHTFVFLKGNGHGFTTGKIIERFLQAFGSPNLVVSPSRSGMEGACWATQGVSGVEYDFSRTRLILSFGASLLEGQKSLVHFMNVFGDSRGENRGRMRLIQIEPRLSITGAKADLWVPIQPNTYASFALGIAHILVRDGLYDKEFIEKFTIGFEDWIDESGKLQEGLKTVVLRDYTVEHVSEITGVPLDILLKVAYEFAQTRPAIALSDWNATWAPDGFFTAIAIHSLNALVGSIDVPGGVLLPPPLPHAELPPLPSDTPTHPPIFPPEKALPPHIPEWAFFQSLIENHLPYMPEVLFLYHTNPVYEYGEGEKIRKALDSIPFIVAYTSLMNETAEYADLVLPEPSVLERWEDVPAFASGTTLVGIAQPVVTPLYDTLSLGDFLIRVAKAVEGSLSSAFPFDNLEQALNAQLDALFSARRGTPFTDPLEVANIRSLEERGWWTPVEASPEDFKTHLLKKGGWLDPYYPYGEPSRIYQTPSRQFEFFPFIWKRLGTPVPPSPIPSIPSDAEYPLFLVPYFPLGLWNGGGELPWLQEILSPIVPVNWDSWVEMNPQTAQKLGIEDGEMVWVETPAGRVKTRAKVYPGVPPNGVAIPAGLGHSSNGRYARGKGISVAEILTRDVVPHLFFPSWFSTPARIRKVRE